MQVDSPVPYHHDRAASHEQVSLDEPMCVARDRLTPERICERLQMDSADEVPGHVQGLIQHPGSIPRAPAHKMRSRGALTEKHWPPDQHTLSQVKTFGERRGCCPTSNSGEPNP